MMNIKINSVNFDATDNLKDLITNKLKKLSQYHERIIDAEVFLKNEKSRDNDGKITEIKIEIPKHELFAKKQSESFEKSTGEAIEALRKQLIKHKDKNK